MIDVYLDPATLRFDTLPSGRRVATADGVDHSVLAVVERLPSGRWLLEGVQVIHGRHMLDRRLHARVFEEARKELLSVLGCRPDDDR